MTRPELYDPIPTETLLHLECAVATPIRRPQNMSDANRIEAGVLTPKEIALHHLLGNTNKIPYAFDYVGYQDTVDQFATIQDRINTQVTVTTSMSAIPNIARAIFIPGAFTQVMLHPMRNELFDVPKTIACLAKGHRSGSTNKEFLELSQNFARLAIPLAPEYSAVMTLAVNKQKLALQGLLARHNSYA